MMRHPSWSAISVSFVLTLSISVAPQGFGPNQVNIGDWKIYVVDALGKVGEFVSIALDGNNNPHMSYSESYPNWVLKYARWNGSSWNTEVVDFFGGGATSIAIDGNGNPHIGYYGNCSLQYAKWNGSSWDRETVDASPDVGGFVSIALDSGDNPHMSYYDTRNSDLKYARWNGSAWTSETVDSDLEVGRFSSLALDSRDNPHIGYMEDTHWNLKYANKSGDSWSIETVDNSTRVGEFTSVALDSNDNPHISYHDYTNGDLKYTERVGGNWSIEIVDSGELVGHSTSIALDSNDNPHISYGDSYDHDLRYAEREAGAWSIEIVDSVDWVGGFTSIALDTEGNPHIGYDDGTNRDLKYATKGSFPGPEEPPVADAGPDQTVNEGDTVQFNGTGSFSPGAGSGEWSAKAQIPFPTWSGGSATLGHDVYYAGGNTIDPLILPQTAFRKYDSTVDSWSNLTDLPAARAHLGVAAAAGRVYAIGGSDGNDSVDSTFEFDPVTNAWTTRSPMPVPMEAFGIATVNDRIYVLGGSSTWIDCYPCGSVFEYDPANDSWSAKPDMPTGRAHLAATALDDIIYAIGGDAYGALDVVEAYDPVTETWTGRANMSTPRIGLSAEALGESIYAFGGTNEWGLGMDSAERYDPFMDNWTADSSMLTSRVYFGSGAVDGCMYAMGGIYGPFIVVLPNVTEEYCLSGELEYVWDFDSGVDGDGNGNFTDDVDATGPTPTSVYGDDGNFTVTLKVTDELGNWDIDTMEVTVLNVAPKASADYTCAGGGAADIMLRIAGEKWHDMTFAIFEDGNEIYNETLVHMPGSPNEQMIGLEDFALNGSRSYSVVAYYTPEDDPVNGQVWGATPAWIILRSGGNETARLHHTFNVRHPGTWLWRVDDLGSYFPGRECDFTAYASDPGSDDLTFTWDWGDGTTTEHVYFNDGVGPDPYPSPNVNPMNVTDEAKHSYALVGTYTVTLTVTDDDGGIAVFTLVLTV